MLRPSQKPLPPSNRLSFPSHGDLSLGLDFPQGKKKFMGRPSAIHQIIFNNQTLLISPEEYQ
jgi:hypothetical protein